MKRNALPGLLIAFLLAGVAAAAAPVSAANVQLLGHLDLEGGGMVDVQGDLAVVGHMGPPYATTLIDVADPARSRILSRVPVRAGAHSHKARLCGSILAINVEQYGGGGDGTAGLVLFDVGDPRHPRETAYYRMGGTGVHRFQMDCERRLIYAGGSADGFEGNFVTIIDIAAPARPREVGRWWMPGQQVAAGEKNASSGAAHRTHHPLRLGDRLYVSLWYEGFAILDVSDPARPRLVSHVADRPAGGAPTHTALPVGHRILGRNWLVVFDEEMGGGNPPAFMRLYDITDERHPALAATFHVPPDLSGKTGGRFGAHQPHEFVGPDNLVYAAWFSGGLRVIDISNPYKPREAGHYIPQPGRGARFAESNDVFVDGRGLIYLIDRVSGLDILRRP
ncbi:MAG: LVIVD repeat-containing protein [Syntrophales bacterium]